MRGMARTGALENEVGGKERNAAVMDRVRAQRIANGDVGTRDEIDWDAPVRVWRNDE